MVVNESLGEECRIAILQDNHLEELYSENAASATNVGNIYKGRVTKVEPAIQAAFIDYGQSHSGFLHITDLHPRYFPGSERSERVGKKIPRRERPPMQDALKRGDEVLVQVLKEGIGTKGPTLTSYLSIPGRLLVMMPGMDRVGVSRKVEDEEKRRAMRDILDTLELPEGCGFILRTAGMDRTKTELKRDVAYLTRLWKVMEKRIKAVGAPCELYTESNLLIRTIRDVLRPEIKAIIVDTADSYQRANAFLQVVAPRTAPQVIHYKRQSPIFHAFDVERQIELIHSREVPLPSGGALVIEQTEALVAVDVNSGRSRAARDSETNAYHTNCEAVDEICRQLRLRDLGGLIIHDLIDMRVPRHRRQIEDRFRINLASDRAKTTVLRISEFGIAEMTRQRMRPSLRKAHYSSCMACDGHGELRIAESVGADALRQIGYLLQFDRVARVELVCSTRVASVLLSSKRRDLVEMEDETGKRIDVRVSDTIAADRVNYYAYDERNADIDVGKLPHPRPPTINELEKEQTAEPEVEADTEAEGAGRKKRRRRKRKPQPADATAIALAGGFEPEDEDEDEETDETPRKKRRRRRRRGRGGRGEGAGDAPGERAHEGETEDRGEAPAPAVVEAPVPDKPIRIHTFAKELGVTSKEIVTRCLAEKLCAVKNHMSSIPPEAIATVRAWFAPPAPPEAEAPPEVAEDVAERGAEQEEGGRKRRRRRGGRRHGKRSDSAEAGAETGPQAVEESRETAAASGDAESPDGKKKTTRKRSRSRSRSKAKDGPAASVGEETVAQTGESRADESPDGEAKPAKKKRRRGGRGRKTSTATADDGETEPREPSQPSPPKAAEVEAKMLPPKRGLYRSRRRVGPAVVQQREPAADE